MSATAVVCPHCGKRQSDRDPLVARAKKRATTRDDGAPVDPYRGEPPAPRREDKREPLQISTEEAAALLEVTGVASGAMEYERPMGPLQLVLPRAEASGLTRTIEWALAVIAAPMIVLGFVPMALRPRLWRYIADGSEWGLTLASGVVGGAVLFILGGELFGLSETGTWGLVALCAGALIARAILRAFPPSRL